MKRTPSRTPVSFAGAVLASLLFAAASHAAPSFTQKDIDQVGWNVSFLGSNYDADTDTTSFRYQLTAESWEKDLSHWVLALCSDQIPTGSGSITSVGLDPTTGVSGFKWDDGQAKGTSREYYILLAGYYGEVEAEYSVKGGTYFAIGKTTGPSCDPINRTNTQSLSGTVFTDVDWDGTFDSGEPALSNVSVNLSDGDGNFLATLLTDEAGNYTFAALPAGDYTVSVPSSTHDIIGDFNETLAALFLATTPAPITVSLSGADSDGHLFGFCPETQEIMNQIPILGGTGKTIGFWKHQINVALTGKGRAQIDSVTVKAYLASVQSLFLPAVFQFTPGAEAKEALAILSSTSSKPVDLLKKQLLATELNELAGQGLSRMVEEINGDQLQTVLLGWAECLVAEHTRYTSEQLLAAKDLCDCINNSGE